MLDGKLVEDTEFKADIAILGGEISLKSGKILIPEWVEVLLINGIYVRISPKENYIDVIIQREWIFYGGGSFNYLLRIKDKYNNFRLLYEQSTPSFSAKYSKEINNHAVDIDLTK